MKKLIYTLLLFVPIIGMYPQVTINVPGDYPSIQEAIDAANNGDIVLVADGTYLENINYRGKAITIASLFLVDGDETHIANTIIDGSQPSHPDSGSVVSFKSGEDSTSVLCGFTITGGTGTITVYDGTSIIIGGGIYGFFSGATIKRNIIKLNVLEYNMDAFGGGIGFAGTGTQNLIIENNIIRNNSINTPVVSFNSLGGGIYVSTGTNTNVSIVNNQIIENSISAPTAYGGGLSPYGGANYSIFNNLISNNTLNANFGGGGGIDIYFNTPNLRNNLLVDNSAPFGGGLLIEIANSVASINTGRISISNNGILKNNENVQTYFAGASVHENNTIVNNSVTVSGGGIHIISGIPQFMNFIIWGNTAPSGPQISGTADVQYSDIEGGYAGTGNINVNPQFIPDTDFYLLAKTSPCIDTGNPDPLYNDTGIWPAQGTLTNDMGHLGGPYSSWYQEWPVPVELTSFTATSQAGKVNLNWSTATEVNNLGFEIERASSSSSLAPDGTTPFFNNWILIGFKEGYGTTTEPREYSFVDDISSISASSIAYRLKQIDFDGSYEYSDEVLVDNTVPLDFALHQNYPNPFNPVTTIKYSLPVKSNVKLIVYNTLGEDVIQLVNEEKEAGSYEIEFDARGLSSGIYLYKMQVYPANGGADKFVEIKKMILLK